MVMAMNYYPFLIGAVGLVALALMLLRVTSEIAFGASLALIPLLLFLLLCKRLDCGVDQNAEIIVRNFVRTYHLNAADVDHIGVGCFVLGVGDDYPTLVSRDGSATPVLALYKRRQEVQRLADTVGIVTRRRGAIRVELW